MRRRSLAGSKCQTYPPPPPSDKCYVACKLNRRDENFTSKNNILHIIQSTFYIWMRVIQIFCWGRKKITHKRDEKHAPHWRILYSNHNITWNMHEYCNDTFWILLYNNHNILGARMLWTASDAAACCSCDVGSSNYGNWAKARIINKIP